MRTAKSHGVVRVRKARKRVSRLALGVVVALLSVAATFHLGWAESHALVVGIGTYQSENLKKIHADIDAQEMVLAFEGAGIDNIYPLINEDATQTAIFNWFDVAERTVSAGDTVFLYLAGHGGLVTDFVGRESESAAFYPYDADVSGGAATDRAITDVELGTLVTDFLRDCTVIVFVDACHSGGLARDDDDGPLVSRGEGVSRGFLTAVRERGDDGRTLFLSSCAEFQQSWEYPGMSPTGVFTSYLVEAMTCADTDPSDGQITFKELTAYVTNGVHKFVAIQEGKPQLPVSEAAPAGTESDDFVLFATPGVRREVERIVAGTAVATSVSGVPINIPDQRLEDAIRIRLQGYTGTITEDLVATITTFDAPSSGITSLEGLQTFTNLDRLDLRGNEIEDLGPLAQLNLQTLKITSNNVISLGALENSTRMQYLDAEWNQIDDISSLAGMEQIEWLLLGNNQISSIDSLSGAHELLELILSQNKIENIGAVGQLEKLEKLYLESNQIVDITSLAGLTNLSELHLRNNQIADITPLAGLTNLTRLSLYKNQIVDITSLAGLTNLTEIHLGSNQIADITPLAGLTNLIKLWLMGKQIVDVTPLASLTNLTMLLLEDSQIVDITPLASLTNLTALLLMGSQIVDITPLASLTNLTQLILYGSEIVDITPLAGLTNLTLLILAYNQIADITPLAGLTNLTRLDLFNNQIVDIIPLAGLTNLTKLDLRFNQIADITPLAGLINLTLLTLENSQIVDITPLAGLTNLTLLDLSDNQIVDITSLAGLTNLTWLDLRGNQIANIEPLINNAKLGTSDIAYVANNALDLTPGSQDMLDIETLRNRGVDVSF